MGLPVKRGRLSVKKDDFRFLISNWVTSGVPGNETGFTSGPHGPLPGPHQAQVRTCLRETPRTGCSAAHTALRMRDVGTGASRLGAKWGC